MQKLIRALLLALGVLVSFWAHAEYLLGPGDMVRISVYGNPDLGNETRVTQEGKLTFPLLGEVPVGGTSVAQSEKTISSMLEAGGFLKNAQVNIVVLQFASQQISILGNVLKPGRFPLEQRINLVEALALAGGINQAGADTVTVLARKGGNLARHEIDVDALLRGGDTSSNLELAAGDVLYVPRAPMFYVYGEVQRPGAFRLERNMMVVQALATGGGLTMRGTERGLRIKRRNADGVLEIIEAGANDLLRADDVLVVRESLF